MDELNTALWAYVSTNKKAVADKEYHSQQAIHNMEQYITPEDNISRALTYLEHKSDSSATQAYEPRRDRLLQDVRRAATLRKDVHPCV
ncbi:hypothetical protein FQN52_006384 [Onygenales sp. PD_12]|nr:hypothetical protein FQN53_005889 [Emmonsiellopsis sp. PD_33]KAK2789121.1 hypothetical protein FQN52_006384 [Onygenales sp. PD_12]